MAQNLDPKFLSYDDLRRDAEKFLQRYHPSRSLPVPIEEIIDLQLQLDIVPMPNLRSSFDCEAFITSDMTAIYVDGYTYENIPTRYRFSLAHEIAHAVLHQSIYRNLQICDLASWKISQVGMDEEAYGWLEWQAYAFASLMLVPEVELGVQFAEAVRKIEEVGRKAESLSEPELRMVCGYIARQFDVSTQVVEKRLKQDKLAG